MADKYPDFNQGASTSDVMSITDVYGSIRDAPRGSVFELSVFSPAWVRGPVLVNSSDRQANPTERDPDDKDARASLDFGATMGVGSFPTNLMNLTRFMLAFDFSGADFDEWRGRYWTDPTFSDDGRTVASA